MSLAMKLVKHQGTAAGLAAVLGNRSRLGSRVGGITPNLPPGITMYGGPMVYSRARAGQQGDFGSILSGIGKAVSFIPGIGTIAGAGLQAIGGAITKKPKAPSIAPAAGPGISSGGALVAAGGLPAMPQLGGLTLAGGTPTLSKPGTAMVKAGSCAPSGYHWNKSGYWKNESGLLPGASWQEPGTVLVRNRKRNPFNPRAASRAMSRLASLSMGMRTLERQMAKLAPRKPRSSRCGCTTKRK